MNYSTELDLQMELKSQLVRLIRKRGMTITTLSKNTKIPAQTIHNWIAGSKPRDFDQVKKVADYFGVSLDFLVYGIERPVMISTEIEKHRDEINAGVFEVVLRKINRGER